MKIEEGFQRWGIELIDEEEEEEAMESGLREEEWRGKLVLVNWHLGHISRKMARKVS